MGRVDAGKVVGRHKGREARRKVVEVAVVGHAHEHTAAGGQRRGRELGERAHRRRNPDAGRNLDGNGDAGECDASRTAAVDRESIELITVESQQRGESLGSVPGDRRSCAAIVVASAGSGLRFGTPRKPGLLDPHLPRRHRKPHDVARNAGRAVGGAAHEPPDFGVKHGGRRHHLVELAEHALVADLVGELDDVPLRLPTG